MPLALIERSCASAGPCHPAAGCESRHHHWSRRSTSPPSASLTASEAQSKAGSFTHPCVRDARTSEERVCTLPWPRAHRPTSVSRGSPPIHSAPAGSVTSPTRSPHERASSPSLSRTEISSRRDRWLSGCSRPLRLISSRPARGTSPWLVSAGRRHQRPRRRSAHARQDGRGWSAGRETPRGNGS
jgi:hypothetical protein